VALQHNPKSRATSDTTLTIVHLLTSFQANRPRFPGKSDAAEKNPRPQIGNVVIGGQHRKIWTFTLVGSASEKCRDAVLGRDSGKRGHEMQEKKEECPRFTPGAGPERQSRFLFAAGIRQRELSKARRTIQMGQHSNREVTIKHPTNTPGVLDKKPRSADNQRVQKTQKKKKTPARQPDINHQQLEGPAVS